MNRIYSLAIGVVSYLGDAGHRRFLSIVIALTATKLLGHAVGQDQVANILDLAIGGTGAAWTRDSVQPPAAVETSAQ